MHLLRIGHCASPRPPAWLLGDAAGLMTALCLAFGATAQPAGQGASAAEVVLPPGVETAFFHVHVQGELNEDLEGAGSVYRDERWGKAFAIGPDTLLTAQHVVGSRNEWKAQPTDPTEPGERAVPIEIRRVVQPLAREVTVVSGSAERNRTLEPIVLPAVSDAIDAAALTVPGLGNEIYFKLSLCSIERSRSYTAIVASNDPTRPESVQSPVPVTMIATGYNTQEYGGLYEFRPIDPLGVLPGAEWGHGGSPILDENTNVVAIVSAVVVESDVVTVLATPIQPLNPGAISLLAYEPAGSPTMSCSMADTVRRISEQVAAYATWNVVAETELDGRTPTGDLLISYDPVVYPPNITALQVSYDFWGIERQGASEEPLEIPQGLGPESDPITPTESGGRVFEIEDLAKIGRRVEIHSREDSGLPQATIYFVRLRVIPVYSESGPKPADLGMKFFERDIPWAALNPPS